jgi:hypothetical protein
MFSLYGNVYGGAIAEDTTVLRQVVKGGNLPEKEKKKTLAKIAKIEKEQKEKSKPAIDLRAMYGN